MAFLIENTNFTRPQIKAWYKGFMVRYYNILIHTFKIYVGPSLLAVVDL